MSLSSNPLSTASDFHSPEFASFTSLIDTLETEKKSVNESFEKFVEVHNQRAVLVRQTNPKKIMEDAKLSSEQKEAVFLDNIGELLKAKKNSDAAFAKYEHHRQKRDQLMAEFDARKTELKGAPLYEEALGLFEKEKKAIADFYQQIYPVIFKSKADYDILVYLSMGMAIKNVEQKKEVREERTAAKLAALKLNPSPHASPSITPASTPDSLTPTTPTRSITATPSPEASPPTTPEKIKLSASPYGTFSSFSSSSASSSSSLSLSKGGTTQSSVSKKLF